MVSILVDNPLLLLFVVAAIGYPLGRIKVGGSSLGVAAVLFVGLAFGSLHPELQLPEPIYLLGLVLFVYTVGLSSGPGFVGSFRGRGVRYNALVLGILTLAALLVVVGGSWLQFRPAVSAGLFTGSMGNPAALAAVLDYLETRVPGALPDQLLSDPVAGFSVAYPMCVLGTILTIYLAQRTWKIDYAAEARRVHERGLTHEHLQNRTIRVTRPEATRAALVALMKQNGWDVVFGRVQRGGELAVPGGRTRLQIGDLVSVVGTPDMLDGVTAYLGEPSDQRLELDHSQLDYRSVFVSNHQVAGHRLRDLNLPQQFGAVVTRLRRGDIELLPHGDTVLELGDRVRVLARRDNMDAASRFFGDSYRGVSEVDILSFSLGLTLGLVLGMIPFPLPGGGVVKLGYAGGPLIVALTLGWLERTGPIIWSLPYSANVVLRQVGLVCFLASIGTRSGHTFATTLAGGGGAAIFVAGSLITGTSAFLALWIGYRLLKIPMGLLIGLVAGLQTQAAVLGFALDQTNDDLPNVGYATVFPVALVTKIILAQVLLIFLL